MSHPYFSVLITFLGIFWLQSCQAPEQSIVDAPNIIPAPDSMTLSGGQLASNQTFNIVAKSEGELATAALLQEQLWLTNQVAAINTTYSAKEIEIQLQLSEEANLEKEAYELVIDNAGIKINASAAPGLFYGSQSLLQILSSKGDALPQLKITDAPRFGYRGMHLDVGRHMFPVAFIKKYIDMMSHFKFNRFHWHLTEDQGWRIEIKQYPELQNIGAFRKETAIGYATTATRDQVTYDGVPYGGFYTQEDVKEIVAYAQERHIMVIPEIELPGHASAALAAYPHLGCTGGPYHTATTWGVFQDIYCVGQESTFEFLENVFDEVLPLFPGPYVHIGGDEAPKSRWENCPHAQQRMKEEGLANESELQSYFVQRIEKFLNSRGKSIIGWDEILEGGLAPNAIVMSWRGEEGGIEAAKENHQVIMTPGEWCYFDYYQADMEAEPLAIKRITAVEKVYSYEPVPPSLSEEEQHLVLGAQCNLWSQYITSSDHAEYMVYPRALAMSEVLWSPKGNRDYEKFVKRASSIRPLMDAWEINYATHIFDQKQD
ncbi:MAG: beta-N-acetylhexosaminidase [Cytophagales bacterium]|nr:beta-N-acetylhexosaminidase [Cytophagales bacterium]